jgi:cyclohexanone monooxygenase
MAPEDDTRRSTRFVRASTVDVVVVGAGFSGLYALHLLRSRGLDARVLEAGGGVGGTWYWNRYPGARCDVESLEYSYSFSDALQQEWDWTERYATQPEILTYLEHVADRFDLRRDIRFNTRVTAARFDTALGRWVVRTDRADEITAQFCVMATGMLSVPKTPDLEGLATFAGDVFSTGAWPHEGVDFTGRRVGVVGTGSSAIQSIPVLATEAQRLVVFQRTPNFSVPAANRPLDPDAVAAAKARYAERRAEARWASGGMLTDPGEHNALEVSDTERCEIFEQRWERGGFTMLASFADLMASREANDTLAWFIHDKIRAAVTDPSVAERLLPVDHPVGTKRICVDTGYYETYNHEHVTLVDLRRTSIETITPGGVRTATREYELDCLVLAIGFDAMTGALERIDIRGTDGVSLREAWSAGPQTYLGLMTAGFPNLFLVTGPGSPSVLSNMVVSIEQHVEWIADCIGYLGTHGLERIAPTPEAQEAWVARVNEVAAQTLMPTAASWYMGANVPGKPRVFMPFVGGVGVYREICDDVVARGYDGFALTSAAPADAA